jgi:hypothetical protein
MKTNIEAQMLSLESANISLAAQEGMQAGLDAQRHVSHMINVDAVAEMQQEIEEHLNNSDEVARVLATPHNAGEIYDDDALIAELNEEMGNIGGGGEQSETTAPIKAKAREDDLEELKRLMESMPTAPSNEVGLATSVRTMAMSESARDLLRLEAEMGS